MHPVFVKRCRRDDLEVESMWLEEEQLELDDGQLLPIEQPTSIQTRALDEEDQDDRLRAVFGLTSDDPIPVVEEVTLRLYHAHLAMHLVLPFECRFAEDEGPLRLRSRPVTVLGLSLPEEADEEVGLLCEVRMGDKEGLLPLAEIERDEKTPQGRLLADYSYWLHNWPGEGQE